MKEDKAIRFLQQAQAILDTSAVDDDSLAFLARILVQVTLPHRNPKVVNAWGRRNGDFSLTIQPGVYTDKNDKIRSLGIPFGNIPRLLMAYITTEAVKNKNPEVILGDCLSSFMRELGLTPTGGRHGSITRLRDQMKRLFSSRISFAYDGENRFAMANQQIASKIDLWWDTKSPYQATLLNSRILLTTDFFEEITRFPVPLDMRALKALKQSPLALDLYTWLTYRVSYLKKPQKIKWETLSKQFGCDYGRTRDFRSRVRKYLLRIKEFYPDLKLDDKSDYLTLYPSPTHIPKMISLGSLDGKQDKKPPFCG